MMKRPTSRLTFDTDDERMVIAVLRTCPAFGITAEHQAEAELKNALDGIKSEKAQEAAGILQNLCGSNATISVVTASQVLCGVPGLLIRLMRTHAWTVVLHNCESPQTIRTYLEALKPFNKRTFRVNCPKQGSTTLHPATLAEALAIFAAAD